MDHSDIEDAFAVFGPVRVRRMFGGQGIFADDLMFALCIDGQIYLKTDPALAEALREAGSEPFRYAKKSKTVTMNFWSLPDAALDDGEVLADFARQSLSVARAAARRSRASDWPTDD